MRVLLATTQFMPEVGGVPRLLWKLCLHKPREHDLFVLSVCQLSPEVYPAFDQTAAVPVERVRPVASATRRGVAGSGLTSLRFLWQMLASIRRNQVEMILCGVGFPTAIIAAAASAFTGVPYAVITHSEDLTIQKAHDRRLLGRALNGARAIFILGSFGRQQLEKLGVTRPPVFVVPPGIDPESFLENNEISSPAARARRGQGPSSGRRSAGDFTLLTVARLVHRKGQDLVIRALPALREKVPGIRYVVVGSGPDEAAIRGLTVELGVADRVTFAGGVSDALLPGYYRDCDVFVMPTRPSEDRSEVEGFGIVYLEAGAAGKPVIGGRSGGVEDAVVEGITGFLVDPFSVEDLARRVEQLAVDPHLAHRMGCAGRERVIQEFTAARYSQKIFQALEQARAMRRKVR